MGVAKTRAIRDTAAFHQILLNEIGRQGVPIEYGKRLCGIEYEGNLVVARFEDGTVERTDMLLAFDGVHSRARALILPDCASHRYTGFLGIGGFAEAGSVAPTDPQDAHRLSFGVGSLFQFSYAMVSGTPARWGWWTHLPQEQELTQAELQAVPDDVMRDRILGAFKGWHSPVEALVSNTGKITRTAIYDVLSLPRWHVARVMLLGDAAHAMSPAGGQGASLALEDAMLVGQFLANGGGLVTEAFAKAESVQRLRAERTVKEAAENDRRQVKELGPFGQWMRDRMLPLFTPVIARQLRRPVHGPRPYLHPRKHSLGRYRQYLRRCTTHSGLISAGGTLPKGRPGPDLSRCKKMSCEVRVLDAGLITVADARDSVRRYPSGGTRPRIFLPHFYTIAPPGTCGKTRGMLHHRSRKQNLRR